MGAPLRLAGLCVALWVTLVARAEAQAGDNLQAPDGTAGPFPTTDGIRRFINGPTVTSIDARRRMKSRFQDETLKSIGGRVEEDKNGMKWVVNGHSYVLADSTGTGATTGPVNGHTGRARGVMMGQATLEGQHHPYQNPDIAEQEQVSGSGGGQGEGESPDSNGAAGNKSSPVPAVAWTREPDQWAYQEWVVVTLPDPSFPSLPPPPSPSPAEALVVTAINKAEVARQVTGLANVTLHYLFFLSENQHPDTRPELKVYQEVAGMRTLLQADTDQGQWYSRTVDVPQADNSSILFEGWLRDNSDVIALSDVRTEGVPMGKDDSLDEDDDLTFTARQPPTTTTAETSQTLAAEANLTQTQDLPTPEDAPTATDTEAQDDSTTSDGPLAGVPLDQPSKSTAEAPLSPAEGNVAVDEVTETPDVDPSTDTPGEETQTTEEVSGGVDIVAMNSTTSGDDEGTLHGHVSDSFSTTATTGKEGNTDEEQLANISATDDEVTAPESISGTGVVTNSSTTLSIPGVTTDGLQANSTTSTTSTLTNTNTSVSQRSGTPNLVPTKIEYTDESEDMAENILGGDELTSGTTPGESQADGTSGTITSPSGITVPLESTPLPSASGNTTEAVSAKPVSSTSWQVFQVFLILCALGLLALGFLYWKKKRRQDDEIPVFQRGTDYHNPAFSMEDAANFMSRAGRNTYKTIE